MPYPELVTTSRLTLRRWDAALHTEPLTAVNADADVMRFLNAGIPLTPAESAVQSARFAAHWDQYGFGLWAVEITGTAAVVGFTGLCHPLWFPAYAHEVEAGWRLDRSAWGRGYATEAGRAALDAGAAVLEPERVVACIDRGNDASVAVASRLGMTAAEVVADPHGPGELLIYEAR